MHKLAWIIIIFFILIISGCSDNENKNICNDIDNLMNNLQDFAKQNGIELKNPNVFYQKSEKQGKIKFYNVGLSGTEGNYIECWINEDNSVNNVLIDVSNTFEDGQKAGMMIGAIFYNIGFNEEEYSNFWKEYISYVNDILKEQDGSTPVKIDKTFHCYCSKVNKMIILRVTENPDRCQFFIRAAKSSTEK